jgi:hypothetical protein
MKKIFALASKRIFPLLVLMCLQAKAWALDTTTTATINKSISIFAQPWIWIGIIVVAIIILIGPLNDTKEYHVTMKKKTSKKKWVERYIR